MGDFPQTDAGTHLIRSLQVQAAEKSRMNQILNQSTVHNPNVVSDVLSSLLVPKASAMPPVPVLRALLIRLHLLLSIIAHVAISLFSSSFSKTNSR